MRSVLLVMFVFKSYVLLVLALSVKRSLVWVRSELDREDPLVLLRSAFSFLVTELRLRIKRGSLGLLLLDGVLFSSCEPFTTVDPRSSSLDLEAYFGVRSFELEDSSELERLIFWTWLDGNDVAMNALATVQGHSSCRPHPFEPPSRERPRSGSGRRIIHNNYIIIIPSQIHSFLFIGRGKERVFSILGSALLAKIFGAWVDCRPIIKERMGLVCETTVIPGSSNYYAQSSLT